MVWVMCCPNIRVIKLLITQCLTNTVAYNWSHPSFHFSTESIVPWWSMSTLLNLRSDFHWCTVQIWPKNRHWSTDQTNIRGLLPQHLDHESVLMPNEKDWQVAQVGFDTAIAENLHHLPPVPVLECCLIPVLLVWFIAGLLIYLIIIIFTQINIEVFISSLVCRFCSRFRSTIMGGMLPFVISTSQERCIAASFFGSFFGMIWLFSIPIYLSFACIVLELFFFAFSLATLGFSRRFSCFSNNVFGLQMMILIWNIERILKNVI